MTFIPPIPLIRRNLIVRRLTACGAVSPETAKTLREACVLNPNGFGRVTETLVRRGTVCRTADGRYWLPGK